MQAVKHPQPTTMQVRVHLNGRVGGQSYFYFPGVSARRAAELAAMACSAQCMDVDYFEVIDDQYEYDEPGILFATWDGRPLVTINS